MDRAYWSQVDWCAREWFTVGESRTPDVAPITGRYALDAWEPGTSWLLRGQQYVVDGVQQDPRLPAAVIEACARLQLRASLALPVLVDGKLRSLLAVDTRTPRHWTADEIALVEAVAGRCWAEVERARAEAALLQSEEKYRTLFNSIDEGYALVELERDENRVGKDLVWLEVNPAFERQSGAIGIVGKRASEFVPNIERYILDLNQGVADTGVPKCIETFNSDLDRWFDAVHIRVGGEGSNLLGVVFSDVTERKRREQLQEYLLQLNDALRPLAGPLEIQAAAADLLGKELDVNQAYFGERVGDYIYISHAYANGLPPMTGRFHYEDFGKRLAEGCRSGEVQVCNVAATDSALSEADRQVLASINMSAYVALPFVKDGEWVATLAVHSIKPRKWKDHEIELIKETAERTWAAWNARALRRRCARARSGRHSFCGSWMP